APIGYFFDVATNGYGIMLSYSAQVSVRDRWCIAAYIRALQLSQHATAAEVPAGQAIPSKAPDFMEPGTGATLPQIMPKAGKAETE
ncbi:MAG: cytochrome c, partial [Acidimicrobiales bacterium]